MKLKRIFATILFMMMAMLLTACDFSDHTYNKAQELLSKGNYTEAAEKFESLGSYEDASYLAIYCKACALCEAGDFKSGIAALNSLGDFKDCAYRVSYYTARSWDDRSVDTTVYEWMEQAKSIYNENPLYLDSAERIAALDERISEAKITLYLEAEKIAENGQFEEAIDCFERLDGYAYSKKYITYCGIRIDEDSLTDSSTPETVYAIATRYLDLAASVRFLDCADRADALIAKVYDTAVALMNEEKYSEAYDAFLVLNEYKDSIEQAESIHEKAIADKWANGEVGFFITFGSYEQDNDLENGKEDIEWLVLANENNQLLVISRNILDEKRSRMEGDVTWETSAIRAWLNDEFLNEAFTQEEQLLISTVTVTADSASRNRNPGEDTQDKVFLLSKSEAQKYKRLMENASAPGHLTAYARDLKGSNYKNDIYGSWMLRTLGYSPERSTVIVYCSDDKIDGYIDIDTTGGYTSAEYGVRPVMWINWEP